MIVKSKLSFNGSLRVHGFDVICDKVSCFAALFSKVVFLLFSPDVILECVAALHVWI